MSWGFGSYTVRNGGGREESISIENTLAHTHIRVQRGRAHTHAVRERIALKWVLVVVHSHKQITAETSMGGFTHTHKYTREHSTGFPIGGEEQGATEETRAHA